MEQILHYFEQISGIPRCSGNEQAVSNFLLRFAKENRLEAMQDASYNIIIKKPASPGYEQAPAVILQGHLDMVCDKTEEHTHDFARDAIRLRYSGDMIYADGTTLGADNGIAIAYAMAILANQDLEHPRLEVLLTASEETDMLGARSVGPENLSGKILINLDGEQEGKLLTGCAGGVKTAVVLPVDRQQPRPGGEAFTLGVSGLKGGHSGLDMDEGRGNAIKLLGQVLHSLSSQADLQIAQISGGLRPSAIPPRAEAVLLCPANQYPAVARLVRQWDKTLKQELQAVDAGVSVTIARGEAGGGGVLRAADMAKALKLLAALPQGVQSRVRTLPRSVESSVNLGVVATTEESIVFESLIRSSADSRRDELRRQTAALAALAGADFQAYAEIPAWEHQPKSRLLALCQDLYREMTGQAAETETTHASVECALLAGRIGDLDMISLGPDVFAAHTPWEHVSVPSIQRTYAYLLRVLRALH